MSRIVLRVSVTLLIIHAALTFAISFKIFPGFTSDTLAFAQHGFGFFFLAILNLIAWQPPLRTRRLGYAVHACNVTFLAFNLLFDFKKPEPPLLVVAAILLILTISALATDHELRCQALGPLPPDTPSNLP